ncbi:TetR/AcrR family transcriptional regulator [Streptomyces sp. NPDC001941]|uniref:TetR/AcrR family transcriptional regulator n=1 Tax=Streptomyces sp. NPDC001941 TaxID=3154659 RepID=UPI003321BC1E
MTPASSTPVPAPGPAPTPVAGGPVAGSPVAGGPVAGRPVAGSRSERVRRAILDAAFDLIAERGYGKVTIEAIAAAAGTGKPTIYRRWTSRGEIALAAISDRVGDVLAFPDTGDVTADLTAQMTRVADLLDGDVGAVFRCVIAEAQADPAVSAGLRAAVIEPHTRACQQRLERAVAARQLRDDVPARLMVEMIYAPLYYRFLLHTDPIGPGLVREGVVRALDGLRPSRPPVPAPAPVAAPAPAPATN